MLDGPPLQDKPRVSSALLDNSLLILEINAAIAMLDQLQFKDPLNVVHVRQDSTQTLEIRHARLALQEPTQLLVLVHVLLAKLDRIQIHKEQPNVPLAPKVKHQLLDKQYALLVMQEHTQILKEVPHVHLVIQELTQIQEHKHARIAMQEPIPQILEPHPVMIVLLVHPQQQDQMNVLNVPQEHTHILDLELVLLAVSIHTRLLDRRIAQQHVPLENKL